MRIANRWLNAVTQRQRPLRLDAAVVTELSHACNNLACHDTRT